MPMTPDDLTGELLRSVSRTFAVSIRLLPRALREPMGLAYLLARTSDTIADAPGAPADVRAGRLEDFGVLLASGSDPQREGRIRTDIRPGHAGERNLLDALPRVLARFGRLPEPDRGDAGDLLATILAGQLGDLRAFADPARISALPDARALEAYTQAVAGSVGEWWTRMCYRHLPRYADRPEGDLVPLGAALGRALQLVNILRDMPADLGAGRCYLPEDELAAAGTDPARLRTDPLSAQPVFTAWSRRARRLLEDGRDYVRAVRPWRLRAACSIPWRLAVQTLDLMDARPPLACGGRVKLSRVAVRGTILRGLAAALGDWPLR